MNLAQLESEICSLPIQDRAFLVQRLLLSFEEISELEFERLWGDESAHRAAEFDASRVQAIPSEDTSQGHISGSDPFIVTRTNHC